MKSFRCIPDDNYNIIAKLANNKNKYEKSKIIILVVGLLIVVLGVILESTNTANLVGRMDGFLRKKVSTIEMRPTKFIPTLRIAETFESTLKIKRVTEANQFVLSSPFGGKYRRIQFLRRKQRYQYPTTGFLQRQRRSSIGQRYFTQTR